MLNRSKLSFESIQRQPEQILLWQVSGVTTTPKRILGMRRVVSGRTPTLSKPCPDGWDCRPIQGGGKHA
jgi:hypothetical protein